MTHGPAAVGYCLSIPARCLVPPSAYTRDRLGNVRHHLYTLPLVCTSSRSDTTDATATTATTATSDTNIIGITLDMLAGFDSN
jgi:hypothetical protein